MQVFLSTFVGTDLFSNVTVYDVPNNQTAKNRRKLIRKCEAFVLTEDSYKICRGGHRISRFVKEARKAKEERDLVMVLCATKTEPERFHILDAMYTLLAIRTYHKDSCLTTVSLDSMKLILKFLFSTIYDPIWKYNEVKGAQIREEIITSGERLAKEYQLDGFVACSVWQNEDGGVKKTFDCALGAAIR